jgi:spore germination protein
MQIHVVQQGQTLTQIAQLYGSSVTDITEANELPNPNNLVVGRAMVIPIVGSFEFVQPGYSQ